MKLILYLITSLTIISLNPSKLNAQKEGNQWYFGAHAALDFNAGEPVIKFDNEMASGRSTSSISDAEGNLLFYSNGNKVYDRYHTIMPNGGDLSGSGGGYDNSVLIVKKPLSSTLYYLFYIGSVDSYKRLYYSVIDMSLNGGAGDVSEIKDITLTNNVTLKVSGCLHGNNKDIWIMTHKKASTDYYAYLLTEEGIQPVPVISSTGSNFKGAISSRGDGQLQFSPYGNKIAVCDYNNVSELLDFNKLNGVVSNPLNLSNHYPNPLEFGCEFSASGNVLYFTAPYSGAPAHVIQYDLTASDIIASKQILTTPVLTSMYDMQLASNGKIYLAPANGDNFVSVINNPEILGEECDLIRVGITLVTTHSGGGLPNFINSINAYTDVEEISDFPAINVYPNPFTNHTKVYFETDLNLVYTINIYNLTGQLIYNKSNMTGSEIILENMEFEPGMYILSVSENESKHQLYSTKIIVE